MSKYVERIMDEVYENFHRHLGSKEEKIWFLEELINKLETELEYTHEKEC